MLTGIKRLDEQNAIAKQVLDDGMTALGNAQAQVKLAKANLLNAETDYNYSVITAPVFRVDRIFICQARSICLCRARHCLRASLPMIPIGTDFFIDQKTLPYFLKLQEK